MILLIAICVAALSGFISLSYEILLYRAISFGNWGAAHAFPSLLGAYLIGIAVGARASRALCSDEASLSLRSLRAVAGLIIGSNLLAYMVLPAISWLADMGAHFGIWLILVLMTSAVLGAQFPLIAHFGVEPDERAGQRVSFLYGANIVGSTLGSLITGVFLLDHFSIDQTAVGLLCVGVSAGAVLFLSTKPQPSHRNAVVGIAAVIIATCVLTRSTLFDHFYDGLLFKDEVEGLELTRIVENKHGVIAMDQNEDIYGNGIYDGKFSTYPAPGGNNILRAYSISLFHPSPKRVLMVGLSSGSWATVVANNPDVEKLVVIEINPGYVEILKDREDRKPLFDHPKVEIQIDDGRRWLMRNPDEKFDVVIANHSHHWRNLASNLLSKEYNDLVKARMNPDGVYIYNTTTSERVYRTAFATWEYVQRFQSCAVASDSPSLPRVKEWATHLGGYEIWGEPVFPADQSEIPGRIAARVVPHKTGPDDDQFEHFYETSELLWERVKDAEVITDDNMGTEWTEFTQ